jgi:hypothetical protein
VEELGVTLSQVEATLQGWLGDPEHRELLDPRRTGPGRPPVLPALVLWAGLLVALLHGYPSYLELWRRFTVLGLWDFPTVEITEMALYKRLERTAPAALAAFFDRITRLLRARFAHATAVPYAGFATEILALDQSVLDALLRKLKLLRGYETGDHALLPGVLACLFDLRRQQWWQVTFSPHALQNEKPGAPALVAGVPKGSLLLFDLGYFSFFWFDYLTEQELYYVSKLRAKASYQVLHLLYAGGTAQVQLRESLVYLGAYAGDRAAHPVRLIEVTRGAQTWRYLTNVLDPRVLPAWEIVALYGYRWDIETAFNVLKTHLGLHLLHSGYPNALLHQVYATLVLSQCVLALRFEIAAQAGCDVREVSLVLMLRWLPRFAARGQDPVAEFVRHGRRVGFLRPFRGTERPVPRVAAAAYEWPKALPPPRPPRYGSAPRPPEHQQQMDRLRAGYAAPTRKGAARTAPAT